jgi:hypothetical protein
LVSDEVVTPAVSEAGIGIFTQESHDVVARCEQCRIDMLKAGNFADPCRNQRDRGPKVTLDILTFGDRVFDGVLFATSDCGQDFLPNGSSRMAIIHTTGLRKISEVGWFTLRDSLKC